MEAMEWMSGCDYFRLTHAGCPCAIGPTCATGGITGPRNARRLGSCVISAISLAYVTNANKITAVMIRVIRINALQQPRKR